MKTFQSLFPPLSPQKISLSSARRVILISYNAERGTLDFRHYIIKVKPHGVSRRVQKVFEAATHSSTGFLNLGREKDVADFLLRKKGEAGPDGGYESASSAESVAGDGDAVDLADDYVGRNNKKGQRRAVRLDEVGPRMELRLIKISEGVPGKEGAVMYHEFGTFLLLCLIPKRIMLFLVRKSNKEIESQKAEHAAKAKLKKQRREEQERNVLRKKGELKDGHEGSESEDEGDGLGEWDDEEDVSDGGEEEDVSSEEEDSSEDEQPIKKVKLTRKG